MKYIYRNYLKRLFDLVISLIVLTLSLPLTVACAAILFIQNEGKIFFVQERPGKNKVAFNIIKFKTMNDKKDSEGNLLSIFNFVDLTTFLFNDMKEKLVK
jgi:lipopolysaccharide/colanic/teichoic acid biosynthesis glycosyltransferase